MQIDLPPVLMHTCQEVAAAGPLQLATFLMASAIVTSIVLVQMIAATMLETQLVMMKVMLI